MTDKVYLCIDLKSFYASVECVERGLDPMTTNLVVADPERSDKTICLAVSPSMKALGVKNRCRVFEIPNNIKYLMAPPRMQKYIDYAAEIYGVYLKYLAPEDIYVYSIDEVFMDITLYLERYNMTAREMAVFLMNEVKREVGVRATAGIGSNLYLCKIALDITAKHSPDFIGELDEESFREKLWDHTPLSDFWRIGHGIEERLHRMGLYTMRQIAFCPEDILYNKFGVDAEIMIDHAWGRESVTIEDIQKYKPKGASITSGQVLMRDYSFLEAELVLKEMSDEIAMTLSSKHKRASSFGLAVGYSSCDGGAMSNGSGSISSATQSDSTIRRVYLDIFSRIADRTKLIRRFYLTASSLEDDREERQLDLFLDTEEEDRKNRIQQAVLSIKDLYGKNSIVKGMDYMEGATTMERNMQIGGHKRGE